MKPGEGGAAEVAQSEFRAKRTEVREPQTRRTDAFPRNGAAGPGCQAATVADGRRRPETDAPRWRKCASWMQGGPTNGRRKPATGGWRAGGRARDARASGFSQQTTSLDHYYPGNRAKLIRFRAKLTSCRIASAPSNQHSCFFIRAKQACYCAK